MNAQECKELAGWLSLEYPAIIEEFNEYKKEDPDFLNVGPSDEYFEVKSEIDELIEKSGFEFLQQITEPRYKNKVSYYFCNEAEGENQLAFVYDCTCIEGGCIPHLSYWDDMFKRTNEYKERRGNNPDYHYTVDSKKIIREVKKILDQISLKVNK